VPERLGEARVGVERAEDGHVTGEQSDGPAQVAYLAPVKERLDADRLPRQTPQQRLPAGEQKRRERCAVAARKLPETCGQPRADFARVLRRLEAEGRARAPLARQAQLFDRRLGLLRRLDAALRSRRLFE
jgi:hypothetical protein